MCRLSAGKCLVFGRSTLTALPVSSAEREGERECPHTETENCCQSHALADRRRHESNADAGNQLFQSELGMIEPCTAVMSWQRPGTGLPEDVSK